MTDAEPHDSITLAPTGDLDRAGARELRDEARTSTARTVVIDLSGVRFVDSSGLGALLALRESLGVDGRQLLLRRPTSQLLRLMSITQTYSQFRWG